MSLQDLEHGQNPRRLTQEMKIKIYELCWKQLADPVNKETDGMILSAWVIALLENADYYPEWFEKEKL